jgi:hypothetical protein
MGRAFLAGVVPVAGGVTVAEQFFGEFLFLAGSFGNSPRGLESLGQMVGKIFSKTNPRPAGIGTSRTPLSPGTLPTSSRNWLIDRLNGMGGTR